MVSVRKREMGRAEFGKGHGDSIDLALEHRDAALG